MPMTPDEKALLSEMMKGLKLATDKQNKYLSVNIERRPGVISYPPDMTSQEAIEWLTLDQKAQDKVVTVVETIKGFPLDVANALWQVVDKKYGYKEAMGTPGFFGMNPPAFLSIPINHQGETTEVLTGNFRIPNVDGEFATAPNGNSALTLQYTGKARDKYHAKEIAALTRAAVLELSLYKGHAIEIDTEKTAGDTEMVLPRFMDLSGDNQLIFNSDTMGQIRAALFNPIEFAERLKRYGVPQKLSTLLGGPYGTGKTLTAKATALKAVKHGRTFIYLQRAQDLIQGYEMAKQWQPAVVFVEDIDRATEDATFVSQLSLTLDGIESKKGDILLVMTTNHEDKIPPILMRDGRIDNFIHVGLPNADSIQRLVELYARDPKSGRTLIDPNLDWELVTDSLSGFIPSTIRGIVEHSKISGIEREPLSLTTADLVNTAIQKKRHAEMAAPRPGAKSAPDRLAESLQEVIFGHAADTDDANAKEQLGAVMAGLRGLNRKLDTKSPVDHTRQLDTIEEKIDAVRENQ